MSDNENENRKTLADIVADMRKRCTPYAKSDSADCRYVAYLGYKEFADRIEAACKRERAEATLTAEKSSAVGNAAAHAMTLDEAIAHAEDVADRCDTSCGREHRQLADWLKELRDIKSRNVGNAAAMREALERIRHLCREIDLTRDTIERDCYRVADSALSAPARNCDVYNHDEALNVWAAEKENERNGCFDEWLYEQSKKLKGEGDA